MATSPQAGVQRINFSDIYGASRNIHDNNPFMQAINVGADLLRKRDDRIKYERALTPEGMAIPDERTSGEFIGDVASKGWQGLKSLGSALATPFMDQKPEAETRVESGSKSATMANPFLMSRETETELPEEVAQGISPVPVASPFMESVTFPTTVVGERAQAAETLPIPANRSQGINWSEANRINPQRAAFDYNRAQDVERGALERDKLAVKAANDNDFREKLLSEMKALTYNINTTGDPAQKQMLSNQLMEINKQYLSRFGAQPDLANVDPAGWLKNYTDAIALDAYGKNANGTIEDTTALKSDIKQAAKAAGITVLDKDIDAWVNGKNSDLERAYNTEVGKTLSDIEIATKTEGLGQTRKVNQYELLDKKYPKLREEGIALVNDAITFVSAGDRGDKSARNNLVKKIARMGSNEALSETDFGRALGRDMGTNFASRITGAVTGSGLPITDKEWAKLRGFAERYANEMRSVVKKADPSGKLLQPIKPWPSAKQAPKIGDTKKVGSVTMVFNGKTWGLK